MASMRDVAKAACVSPNAISKAVKSGRITLDENGKIPDAQKAAEEFMASRDPAKVRLTGDFVPAALTDKTGEDGIIDLILGDDPDEVDDEQDDDTPLSLEDANHLTVRYLKEKTLKTASERRISETKEAEQSGSLISKAQTLKAVHDMANTFKSGLVSFADRRGLEIANELQVEPRKLMAVLERHLREHLEEASDVVLVLPDK
ncbi:conserved hypothetical protein [Roseibium sp. TrichSKD4]|uniref:hypothetical protein n=1 Tax=Roseibium sp. TrichSKD4 TaxID=744980 RepID=UPI0001E56FCB|nr:hypothetical protein [Roseibium sp. TrichSKD4]EFO31348.1 conserved hypothetical protein [Roseibium sp. TrichSKD4]